MNVTSTIDIIKYIIKIIIIITKQLLRTFNVLQGIKTENYALLIQKGGKYYWLRM
jgi:hypothetical protein